MCFIICWFVHLLLIIFIVNYFWNYFNFHFYKWLNPIFFLYIFIIFDYFLY